MLRGAMVGLGNVALNGHLPAWLKSSGFQIAAGVDSSSARRELFLKSNSGGKAFASLEECREPLDFVDVCTPPHTHFELARQALQRKLHVICEKPLVLSETEIKTLRALAAENQKILFTVHNWKYAPICRKAAELLQGGAIGQVQKCAWYVLRDGPAGTVDKDNWRLDPKRAGGGILIDHGWHAFYLILHWLGAEPVSVSASLENRQYADLPVEDTAKVKINFKGAAGRAPSAEIFLTWASRLRKNSGAFEGAKGVLLLEDNMLKLSGPGAAPEQLFAFDTPLSQGSHHPDWFGAVIKEFAAELNDPKLRGANLEIAHACLALIERSKESSARGAPVDFFK